MHVDSHPGYCLSMAINFRANIYDIIRSGLSGKFVLQLKVYSTVDLLYGTCVYIYTSCEQVLLKVVLTYILHMTKFFVFVGTFSMMLIATGATMTRTTMASSA